MTNRYYSSLFASFQTENCYKLFTKYFFLWCCSPTRAMYSLFMRFYVAHNDAPQSVGILWTSDQLVAQTSTWQHTRLTRDKHPYLRGDPNPQYQQAYGRRHMPQTARLLGLASFLYYDLTNASTMYSYIWSRPFVFSDNTCINCCLEYNVNIVVSLNDGVGLESACPKSGFS